MSALETIASVEGLRDYLGAVEDRLESVVAAHPGTVAAVGADALAAGGKRLRPTLTFLSSPVGAEPPVVEGVAVELVHMATLLHDDIVDGAHVRRGRAAAWTQHGSDAAKAAGDHLFAAAFALLAATGSQELVTALADASLALARGEAMQRLQRHEPSTSVDAYLERCALKTGLLFATACALGARFGGVPTAALPAVRTYGHDLGLAFQIADDVLDCAGSMESTGKPIGTDLLDGTASLPLIYAARVDASVAQAIAEKPAPDEVLGLLARVTECGALAEARAVAHDCARRAEAALDDLDEHLDTRPLRAVVRGVVDREA